MTNAISPWHLWATLKNDQAVIILCVWTIVRICIRKNKILLHLSLLRFFTSRNNSESQLYLLSCSSLRFQVLAFVPFYRMKSSDLPSLHLGPHLQWAVTRLNLVTTLLILSKVAVRIQQSGKKVSKQVHTIVSVKYCFLYLKAGRSAFSNPSPT